MNRLQWLIKCLVQISQGSKIIDDIHAGNRTLQLVFIQHISNHHFLVRSHPVRLSLIIDRNTVTGVTQMIRDMRTDKPTSTNNNGSFHYNPCLCTSYSSSGTPPSKGLLVKKRTASSVASISIRVRQSTDIDPM